MKTIDWILLIFIVCLVLFATTGCHVKKIPVKVIEHTYDQGMYINTVYSPTHGILYGPSKKCLLPKDTALFIIKKNKIILK